MPARYCRRASRGLACWADSMRASQGASSASSPASSARTSLRACCSARASGSSTMRSHTGSSQARTCVASPPRAASRWAAWMASSGMLRSLVSSDSQICCSWAVSCALLMSSVARPRTMLCAALGENARCLPSRRAVSSASWVWCASRVALSLMRRARVRRAAPWGRAARRSSAAGASRSSSDQRAARIWAPSCISCSLTEPRMGASCSASCKWLSRVARSCRAWDASAAIMWASARSCLPWGIASPLASRACSCDSAATAALRERMNRPPSMWVSASSSAPCMARSFCCTRQRRAWCGSSSKAARARSAA